MDEMNLKSGLLTSIISKLLKGFIKKKFGYDIDLEIRNLNFVTSNDGKTKLLLNAKAEMKTKDVKEITKNIGLGI